MNKNDLAKKLAEKYTISQDLAKEMCNAVFDLLNETINEGHDVYIHNLGTFKHEIHKAKKVRHPKTGEMMVIPEREVISFKKTNNKISELIEE